jgi:trigger factor
VRLGLLLAEIGRKNNLRVTPEELSKAIVNEARRYPGSEKTVVEFFRKNDDAKRVLASPLLEDKIVDFILEMATVTERSVSVAELFAAGELLERGVSPHNPARGEPSSL